MTEGRHHLRLSGAERPDDDPAHGRRGRGRALRQGRPGAGEARAGAPHARRAATSPSSRRFLEKPSPAGTSSSPSSTSSALREFPGVKFGGPIGDVRDPETGLGIGTMVYGDFSVRVTDPEKLVVGLVGLRRTSNEEFLAWFKSQVLKVIRDRVAELLVKKRWPLLDVTSGAYTEEIEQDVIAGVKPHVDGYGLTVVRMGNFTIGIKPEDEANSEAPHQGPGLHQNGGGLSAIRRRPGHARRRGGDGQGWRRRWRRRCSRARASASEWGWRRCSNKPKARLARRPPRFRALPVRSAGRRARESFAAAAARASRRRPVATKCRGQLAPGAKFCGSCGQPAAS